MSVNASPGYQITPSAKKTVEPTNYITAFDYSHQYAPDVHAQIANIYGNQSISGMLAALGAESSFDSDQVIFTEEGRLHTIYKDVSRSANVFTKVAHVFRVGETVIVSKGSVLQKGIITAVDADSFTASCYEAAGWNAALDTAITAFVYGSEFKKGTAGMQGSLEAELTIRTEAPIILKDRFQVNGSDATQISWVEVDGGWLWYLNSEKKTRQRWEDRLELAMILGSKAEAGSDAATAGFRGTEGLFDGISDRGNVFDGAIASIADIDEVVKRMDKQGKIADNMLYVDRDFSLGVDNMLGALNAGYADGISYGIFKNGEKEAVDLGFRGFKRGNYNFFKTDWKLLNDPTSLGAIEAAAGKARGIMVPMGTTEVYDGMYNGGGQGSKISVPFLTTRYRAAGSENRRLKTWVTGSVGNVKTNDEDSMSVHYLSERLLQKVGLNNFFYFQGA